MAGVLRDGRHPGGRAYGYRPILGNKGALEIVEEEATVIRWIFATYAAGETPRAIAKSLNEEKVPPPRGTRWNASTINGNASRGYGIILNDLYAGRLVWNRVRMLKDPDTGKRISRANPRDEWQTAEAPHLRIIDTEKWERVQTLKSSKNHSPKHEHRRPKRILSGLLRCGACGGGMSTHGRDRHGKLRVRCTAQAESGCCKNTKSFPLERIEAAVFDGMREHLRDPRLIEVYIRRYNAEREKALAETSSRRAKIEARLARLAARRDRMLDMLLDDVVNEAVGRAQLAAMKEEQLALEAELAAAGERPQPLTLHPATIERYLETVDRLAAALADHAGSADRGSVVADFRALVQSVTVHSRGNHQGFEIEVKGRLAALIGVKVFPERYGGSMVAEAGLEPATYGL
jgi:site-specific DNA recombinase